MKGDLQIALGALLLGCVCEVDFLLVALEEGDSATYSPGGWTETRLGMVEVILVSTTCRLGPSRVFQEINHGEWKIQCSWQ